MGGRRIAALLVVALAASACGGTSFDKATAPPTTARPKATKPRPKPKPAPRARATDARAVLVGAVSATSAAKTARMAMTMSMSGIPGAGAASVDATGVVDFVSYDAAMVMNMPGLGGFEQRVVDGIIYMRLPRSIQTDKPWISIDPKKLLGSSLSDLSAGSQSDPSQYLASLAAVSTDVKKVGSDVVRGVVTTRYHAVIDMQKALDDKAIPRAVRNRLSSVAPNFAGAKLPTDAWIDAQGRARKVTMHMDEAEILGSGSEGAITVSIEFFDFGTPVNVQAPPAGQVTAR